MIEQATAIVVIKTASVVFLFLPTDTDAEFKTTTSEDIDRCGLFGQHGWCAQRRNENGRVQTNSFGKRTHSRQNGERFKPIAVGIGGLLPASGTALLRIAIGLEIFSVGNVITHRNAIDPGKISSACLIKYVLKRTGIVLAKCSELDGDLRRRHGLMLPRRARPPQMFQSLAEVV